jgi:hypothetical protein
MRIPSIRSPINWRRARDGTNGGLAAIDPGRRQALKHAAALTVGAVGVTIANAGNGLGRLASPTPTPTLTPEPIPTTTFSLYGRDVRLLGGARRPGVLPLQGERAAAVGSLFKSPDGDEAGRYQAACFFGDERASRLEMHAFELPDGLILGLGSASFGEGLFAVVGGTGRYAGAAGSYTAVQRIREIGGDGSAEFTFTLTGGVRDAG